MEIVIILFGIDILTLSGFFFSCVLAVNSGRKVLEDEELMDWMREYREIEYTE